MTVVALGMGCDRGTSLATLEAAVAGALAGLGAVKVRCLATIDKKRDEAHLLALAKQRGWPLRIYAADALASVVVPNPSQTVHRYMGTPAVAEAAALLAAGTGMDDLLVEKYKHLGEDGKHATVSVAVWRRNE